MPAEKLTSGLTPRYMLFTLSISVLPTESTFSSYALLITGVVSNIVVITMTPQFIISLRELYDQDLRGRWEGIDTGFGVLSRPAASTNAAMSAIAFANTSSVQGESQVVEVDIEVNRLEVLGDGTRQV